MAGSASATKKEDKVPLRGPTAKDEAPKKQFAPKVERARCQYVAWNGQGCPNKVYKNEAASSAGCTVGAVGGIEDLMAPAKMSR
eukprot:CAMPEP_0178426010 /NCGR_PEP_ID=MMETSP0689_2-20121128/29016_1 /TAXON_ID=160604 /ORGANISM="Amphidinium massartii, Strain CS-259" /LENGTH=83 /DNA_ID=CAMNT_0020047687 /DNA_START=42 /DNA_END=294 /DNA_ORIENTATION=-